MHISMMNEYMIYVSMMHVSMMNVIMVHVSRIHDACIPCACIHDIYIRNACIYNACINDVYIHDVSMTHVPRCSFLIQHGHMEKRERCTHILAYLQGLSHSDKLPDRLCFTWGWTPTIGGDGRSFDCTSSVSLSSGTFFLGTCMEKDCVSTS